MAILDAYLIEEGPHLGGVSRVYELPNGYRLSLVNATILHGYKFAWEAAVINPEGRIDYDTPLTNDVEVFFSDEETNTFLLRAFAWARGEKFE